MSILARPVLPRTFQSHHRHSQHARSFSGRMPVYIDAHSGDARHLAARFAGSVNGGQRGSPAHGAFCKRRICR